MHKLNTKYAMYYNKKYNRVGYVFRDRYKSEGIYSEEHLYNCIKYIYNNPVKAGICNKPEEYKYSNYKKNILDTTIGGEYTFLDVDEDKKQICREVINEFLKVNQTDLEIITDNRKLLRKLIIDLKNNYEISLRSIADELGMARETIRNIYRS